MKRKVLLSLTAIILLVALITTIYLDQSNTAKNSFASQKQLEAISKSLGDLNILVDPRIELLSAVQQQSGYFRLTQLDFTYKKTMWDYFNRYNKHNAVKTIRQMQEKAFNYDAPPNVMLYLTNPPALKELQTIPTELISRASGKKKLSGFLTNLRDFSATSDFVSFYNQNTAFYEEMINTVYDMIKDKKLIDAFDDYYGMEANSYNLVLAPMLHSGGYGPRIQAKNGLYDIYGIIGPNNIHEGKNGDLLPDYSNDSIQYIIWHEFGHSFINPTTDQYIAEINQYDILFSYIKELMSSQAYDNWQTCVNEHILRAITARLILKYQGQTAYDTVITAERVNGFFYVPALCESLAYYEVHRDTYPSIESYYPELVKVFERLSTQKLGEEFFRVDFTGPINAAFTGVDQSKVVFITPTQEKDAKVQADICSYVKTIRDKFFSTAEILKDTDAIDRKLEDCLILAYGTMEGNLWLQNYKDTFPFQVKNDKIIADQTYEGTGLVLITAMPNPQDDVKPLLIYTAQDAKDIVNINNVFHGPTDYVIAKNGEELGSGNYMKEKGVWSFKAVAK